MEDPRVVESLSKVIVIAFVIPPFHFCVPFEDERRAR